MVEIIIVCCKIFFLLGAMAMLAEPFIFPLIWFQNVFLDGKVAARFPGFTDFLTLICISSWLACGAWLAWWLFTAF